MNIVNIGYFNWSVAAYLDIAPAAKSNSCASAAPNPIAHVVKGMLGDCGLPHRSTWNRRDRRVYYRRR